MIVEVVLKTMGYSTVDLFFLDNSTQHNSSMSMPEHVQGDLKKLAEWLMFHNFDSYMNVCLLYFCTLIRFNSY